MERTNDARETTGALVLSFLNKIPDVLLSVKEEDGVMAIKEKGTGDPLFVDVQREKMIMEEMKMAIGALKWDQLGEKKYEMGVSKGVLYRKNKASGKWIGVAWNGLTSVSANPDGGDANDQYADNIKYGSIRGAESYGGTIEAFTSPKEFDACDGSVEVTPGISIGQQPREMFRMCYRSEQGNDEDGVNYGYKIHLIYGCTCSPSERTHETINDNPDFEQLSWDFDSTPIGVTGYKPVSEITIDSTRFVTDAEKLKLKEIEDLLYGTAQTEPEMPDPDDLFDLIAD